MKRRTCLRLAWLYVCFSYIPNLPKIALACDDEWLSRPYGDACYLIFDSLEQRRNFTEANDTCHLHQSLLLQVESTEEWYFIKEKIEMVNSIAFWLGLVRTDSLSPTSNISSGRTGWHWADGGEVSWSSWHEAMNDWDTSEPSGISNCVVVDNHGEWLETHCGERVRYICEKQKSVTTFRPLDDSSSDKGLSPSPSNVETMMPSNTRENKIFKQTSIPSMRTDNVNSVFTNHDKSIETTTGASLTAQSDRTFGKQQITKSLDETATLSVDSVEFTSARMDTRDSHSLDPLFVLITSICVVVVLVALLLLCIVASNRAKAKNNRHDYKSSTWPRRRQRVRDSENIPGRNHTYASSLPVPKKTLSIEKPKKKQFASEYENDPDRFDY